MQDRNLAERDQEDLNNDRHPPQWLWQSDLDPWSDTDPSKWTWTPYPEDVNSSIEKAFSSDQTTVNIGKYDVDLKAMIQISTKKSKKTRRVKREPNDLPDSRFLMELPTPSNPDKPKKTINSAFGDSGNFLKFIMSRTAGSFSLYCKLSNLKMDCKATEFQDIIEQVVTSIQKVGETRQALEWMINTGTRGLLKQKFIIQAECAVSEICSNCATLKDFLTTILKLYTMESFICYWVNELMRNENWEQINIFTPYLVCLLYTFQKTEYYMKKKEKERGPFRKVGLSKITMNPDLFGKGKPLRVELDKEVMLYRGTVIEEELVDEYMDNRHFS